MSRLDPIAPPLRSYVIYDGPFKHNPFLRPAIETVLRTQAEKVEAALRDIGESLWTAPDTVQINSYGGYSVLVNPVEGS